MNIYLSTLDRIIVEIRRYAKNKIVTVTSINNYAIFFKIDNVDYKMYFMDFILRYYPDDSIVTKVEL